MPQLLLCGDRRNGRLHRLLTHTYQRFVRELGREGHAKAHEGSGRDAGPAPSRRGVAMEVEVPEDQDLNVPADDGLHSADPIDPGAHAEHAGGAEAEGIDQEAKTAAANAKERREGLAWLQTQPFSKLVLLRLSIEPLRQLMTDQFKLCGWGWEVQQRVRVIDALERGLDDRTVRDFMCTVAASGRCEGSYFQSLDRLFEGHGGWELVTRQSRSGR